MRLLAGKFAQELTRWVRAGVLMVGCTGQVLAEAPVAQPSLETYVSERAAVTAAVNRYNPDSIAQDREFMGAVYQCRDGFSYSVGAGKAGAGNVTVRLRTPQGCITTALWHTHGGAHKHHQYFSDIDTQLVKRTGLPFYMADYTGSLRRFAPGDPTLRFSQARRLGIGGSNQYARGNLVTDDHGHKIEVATRPGSHRSVALGR